MAIEGALGDPGVRGDVGNAGLLEAELREARQGAAAQASAARAAASAASGTSGTSGMETLAPPANRGPRTLASRATTASSSPMYSARSSASRKKCGGLTHSTDVVPIVEPPGETLAASASAISTDGYAKTCTSAPFTVSS